MNVLRSCVGRFSVSAWRARKCVAWAACASALLLLVYVQYAPSDPVGIEKRQNIIPQQQPQPVYQKEQRKENHVHFVENVKAEDLKEQVQGVKNELQQSNDGVNKDNKAPLVDKNYGQEPAVQNDNFHQDAAVGGAVTGNGGSWSGSAFRYNPYGEPVYNHGNRANYIPKHRVVHLDLKGAPPLAAVYKTLVPWLAKWGATALLMEYEDMFPWEGELASIAAGNHYSKEDIADILALAKTHNLQVIPLVQTFGHLEFALKVSKFMDLREVPELPQAICPSKNESRWLIRAMVDQVMALHPKAQFLHLGCDEVFQLGECERCRMKSREALFLDHVVDMAQYVRNRHNVVPIIWHDMLAHVSDTEMTNRDFGRLVEPMVWVYAEDVYRFVPSSLWSKFASIFPTVWSASAFKGAFMEQATVPNLRRHLDNNLNWLDVMSAEESKFSNGFRGIVITGWQRFDHFAVLCELLPAAMPSLAVNLIATSKGFLNETTIPSVYEALNCLHAPKYRTGLDLDTDPFVWDKFSWCLFPGSSFFKSTARLDATARDVRSYVERITQRRGWSADYNRRRNFSSPMRIDEDMEEMSSRLHTVNAFLRSTKDSLLEWFDEWTTAEWLEQQAWPMLNTLQKIQTDSERLKTIRVWPVRPLSMLKEMKQFGLTESPNAEEGSSISPQNRVNQKNIQIKPQHYP